MKTSAKHFGLAVKP